MLTKAIDIIEMLLMQQSVELMMPPTGMNLKDAHCKLFANPIVQDSLNFLLELHESGVTLKVSMATSEWMTDWKKFKEENGVGL